MTLKKNNNTMQQHHKAQWNMDAFLENTQDWAYKKMGEKKCGAKKDYANANMDPKHIILSTVWACVVFVFPYDKYLEFGIERVIKRVTVV